MIDSLLPFSPLTAAPSLPVTVAIVDLEASCPPVGSPTTRVITGYCVKGHPLLVGALMRLLLLTVVQWTAVDRRMIGVICHGVMTRRSV